MKKAAEVRRGGLWGSLLGVWWGNGGIVAGLILPANKGSFGVCRIGFEENHMGMMPGLYKDDFWEHVGTFLEIHSLMRHLIGLQFPQRQPAPLHFKYPDS